MISHITGNVILKDPKYLVIQTVSGLGYKIFSTSSVINKMSTDTPISLWIHNVIREDAFDLYGFENRESLLFFELLLTVSGIGPKSALNILNLASIQSLQEAVTTGQIGYITKVSGISKKIAEKIVLELKGKEIVTGDTTNTSNDQSNHIDALEALKALGYSQKESKDILENIPHDITDTADKIRWSLKMLGAKK